MGLTKRKADGQPGALRRRELGTRARETCAQGTAEALGWRLASRGCPYPGNALLALFPGC